MKKLLNIEYASIHANYWMIYGIVSSFASVFLLGRGYTNTEIGLILAVANTVAVVLQPFTADLADRSKRYSLIGLTQMMTITMMVMTAGIFALQAKSLALSVIFILLIAWHTAIQPLINSLSFKLEESGVHINFGIARSAGSLAYALLMAFLGALVERRGVGILPVSGEIIMAMMFFSLLLTKKQYDKAKAINTEKGVVKPKIEKTEEINLLRFVQNNKVFLIANLGVVGLFFSNSILNNYLMQIVDEVGGNSEDMGRILSVMAFLEIPTLVCFDRLRKKFTCQTMLKVGAVGFTLKIVTCYLAQSVTVILLGQVFQLISFGLFLPAMVHFIDEMMSKGEAVKGQSVFTMMVTLTTIFSSLTGGIILDASGAKMLTLVASVTTAAGMVVIFATVDRIKQKLTIRTALPEDLHRIQEIEASCFPPQEAASFEKYRWRLEHYPDYMLVGEIGGKVSSVVCMIPMNKDVITDEIFEMEEVARGTTAAVLSVMTDPAFQGMGIAAKMLEAAADTAVDLGMEKMALTCKEHLIHFYGKYGYENKGVSASTHGGSVWYDMVKTCRRF